jgi:hypothetical protein
MFYNKYLDSAENLYETYLATVLKAIGIPTRIVSTVNTYAWWEDAQINLIPENSGDYRWIIKADLVIK